MSTKKSSKPEEETPKHEDGKTAVFNYTKTSLKKLSRDEVNEVALSYGLNPKRFNNKDILISAIMLEVNHGMETDPSVLNPQQLRFCELYASDREFFGNGTQSYIEAYDIDVSNPGSYKAARQSAYQLLTNPHILKHIDNIMETIVLNDTSVDKQLSFWITQRADPGASISAIKEYNKLKKRVDAGKLQLNLNQTNYTVSIQDTRGKELSAKYTQAIEMVTMQETPPEKLKEARSVPADVVASY